MCIENTGKIKKKIFLSNGFCSLFRMKMTNENLNNTQMNSFAIF